MRTLIVGGAGYIGRTLLDQIDCEGGLHEVAVFDRLLFAPTFNESCRFRQGDVRNPVEVDTMIREFRPEVVVWLAAIVGDMAVDHDPVYAQTINVEPLRNLRLPDNCHLVFSSTCSVYGSNMDGLCNEDTDPSPMTAYAAQKLDAEWVASLNRSHTILRLPTLMGTSKRMRFDLVVNAMGRSAFKHQQVTVYGDGTQCRPFLHVRDAADAICFAARYKPQGIYCVPGDGWTINDLARAHGCDINHVEASDDERSYLVDGSKWEKLWSHQRTGVEPTIWEIARWIREGRARDLYSPLYHNGIQAKSVGSTKA
jgi:nucleoside-diphosphate-sugar epimerase